MDAAIFNLSAIAQKAAPEANTTFYHKLIAVFNGSTKQLTNAEISAALEVIETSTREAKAHLKEIQKKQRGAKEALAV